MNMLTDMIMDMVLRSGMIRKIVFIGENGMIERIGYKKGLIDI